MAQPVTLMDVSGSPANPYGVPTGTSANPLVVSQSDGAGGTVANSALPTVATASIPTQVASLATTVQIVAANTARKGLLLVNTDANACKIKYGATASATSFTAIVPAGGQWEMPLPIFTGIIHGIWDADGSGVMAITEL